MNVAGSGDKNHSLSNGDIPIILVNLTYYANLPMSMPLAAYKSADFAKSPEIEEKGDDRMGPKPNGKINEGTYGNYSFLLETLFDAYDVAF